MKDKKKIAVIAITGIAILVAGILCRQEWFLMLPLFISLFVMAFQSEANRMGALMGAINSLIYTGAYIYMGVYASAASAVLCSFPFQLATFFNWRKNAYKSTVVFKKMTPKMRIFSSLALIAAWGAMAGVFYYIDYEYALFDSITFLLGIVVQVLTMLAYIEYTYLWLVQAVVGLFLSVQMVMNDYKETTYLIYSVYCLYCIILAFINVSKFYKEQHNVRSEGDSASSDG